MLPRRFAVSATMGALLFIPSTVLKAGYSPTVTEVNVGAVPIDLYNSTSTNATLGYPLPNCPGSYTIRNCYMYLFNNNSGMSPYTSSNYVGQGVTGVRFFFGTGGGFYSTAWDSSGNVQSAWVSNLTTFLGDLKSYGIARVTPTPSIDGWGSTPITPSPTVYDCTGMNPLVFYQAMPFGSLASNGFPDCQAQNNAYSSANANPYFWGWQPLFNLANAVFGAIASVSGLTMAEFDLYQEINLDQFTVAARMFYDNVHNQYGGSGTTDVLGTLRSKASAYGLSVQLNQYMITSSTVWTTPTLAAYDCGSVYGDSALILDESTLLGTLAGGWSYFGVPYYPTTTYNLTCGGSTTYMVQLPVTYASQPTINDVHAAPCVGVIERPYGGVGCGNGDATTTATTLYSDIWSFLYYRSMTGNTAMIGETSNNQNCDGEKTWLAPDNVNGYLASNLYAYHASATTLRPWENEAASCYAFPVVINPPYTP